MKQYLNSQIFKNIKAVLKEEDATLDDIVKVTVLLIKLIDCPNVLRRR